MHLSLNIAHSGCRPSNFMSSFTHFPQVSQSLPIFFICHFHTSTCRHPIIYILLQMPKPSHFAMALPHQPHFECPKNCSNPRYAFYPSRTLQCGVSLWSSHIHLTIIHPALSELCRFLVFITHVSDQNVTPF